MSYNYILVYIGVSKMESKIKLNEDNKNVLR